jgi:hypothetical protein
VCPLDACKTLTSLVRVIETGLGTTRKLEICSFETSILDLSPYLSPTKEAILDQFLMVFEARMSVNATGSRVPSYKRSSVFSTASTLAFHFNAFCTC